MTQSIGTITAAQIVNTVAHYFGLSPDALKGNKRDKLIAEARQVAMYLIREETELSLPKIGLELGGRDHKTILHGYNKISSELNTDPELGRGIAEIRERLL